jgi:hypothetical protein
MVQLDNVTVDVIKQTNLDRFRVAVWDKFDVVGNVHSMGSHDVKINYISKGLTRLIPVYREFKNFMDEFIRKEMMVEYVLENFAAMGASEKNLAESREDLWEDIHHLSEWYMFFTSQVSFVEVSNVSSC